MKTIKKKINLQVTEEQAAMAGISPEQLAELQKLALPGDSGIEQGFKEKVGLLLAKLREKNGLTQREVAHKLGYKGHNFIYLVERGLSKVPASKVDDFVYAYDADVKLSSALYRAFHPDLWDSLLRQMYILLDADYGSIDESIRIWVEDELTR